MKEAIKSLQYKTKANDVDEKGIVTVAVNGIGVLDSQNDISMPGSFDKTLREGMKQRIKWFFNHDPQTQIGVPLEGEERDGNLIMKGALNLDLQLGRDVLAMYKHNLEYGRTMEHSIGVRALQRDSVDRRKVLEWQMFEYSTLTGWGSNPQTFLVDIKSATADQVKSAIDFLSGVFHGDNYGFSEDALNNYDMQLKMMLKALNGANVVKCPYCGKEFDYDEQDAHTFAQQVLETAADYTRWIANDAVAEEIGKLEPEIRDSVVAIIDAVKANGGDFSTKSVEDLMEYVRCPHCWSRVYKTNTLIKETAKSDEEPSEDTLKEDEVEKQKREAVEDTSFFKSINSCFEPNK